jgi:uncharacterized protein YqjF (DUF2071 family)
MAMNWLHLLFIHYPVRPAVLRPFIPPGLELDTFDGDAWIGIVPFRMAGVRPRLIPSLPKLSAFPELNVRTYVKAGGRAGVWFLSLDAASRLTVLGAHLTFHLPYYNAPPAAFEASYRPTAAVYASRPGDLDYFLTERYALFSRDPGGNLHRGDVFHDRWPLQPAEAEIRVNTMLQPFNIEVPAVPPLLHFARRVHAVASALAGV